MVAYSNLKSELFFFSVFPLSLHLFSCSPQEVVDYTYASFVQSADGRYWEVGSGTGTGPRSEVEATRESGLRKAQERCNEEFENENAKAVKYIFLFGKKLLR